MFLFRTAWQFYIAFSCCSNSLLKIWDVEIGGKYSMFHMDESLSPMEIFQMSCTQIFKINKDEATFCNDDILFSARVTLLLKLNILYLFLLFFNGRYWQWPFKFFKLHKAHVVPGHGSPVMTVWSIPLKHKTLCFSVLVYFIVTFMCLQKG